MHALTKFSAIPFPSRISDVQKLPILTQSQEYELAKKFHEEGDLQAAKMLVISNLRFVYHTARSYQGYGLDINDLVQEGVIGLMTAIKKFDYKKNVRLVTFAVYWIKAQIHEFILKNWRIVKIATTKAQRSLFFKLRSKKTTDSWLNNQEASAIAKDLKVKVKDVFDMEKRLSKADYYIESNEHQNFENNSDGNFSHLQLQDNTNTELDVIQEITQKQQSKALLHCVAQLDPKTRDIVQNRWLEAKKMTLKELAAKHSLSMERIRQIESIGLIKLKKLFQAAI